MFGLPLRTSIKYANVAVSLVNDQGESYVHGYIPVLVGKTGMFLKERGEREFATYLRFAMVLTKVQLLESRTFMLLAARYIDSVRCNLRSTPQDTAMGEAGNGRATLCTTLRIYCFDTC